MKKTQKNPKKLHCVHSYNRLLVIWHRQNAVLMHVKNKSSARNANSIPRTHGQKSMTSFNLSSNDIVQSMRWENKHFYPFLALPYRFNFSRLVVLVNQSDTVFYFRWTAIFNHLQYTKLRCIYMYDTPNMYLSLEGFLIKMFEIFAAFVLFQTWYQYLIGYSLCPLLKK